MRISIELSGPQSDKLRGDAQRLGVRLEDLVTTSLLAMLNREARDFDSAGENILHKDRMLSDGWIIDSNYETVTALCEHCQAPCIFNRVDDLQTMRPITGERVACDNCKRQFWIHADVIYTAYEFLINDARERFNLKRYMPAIASLAQAWEVFFAAFARSRYVYVPFFAADEFDRDINQVNGLSNRLAAVTRKFNFAQMRNILINTVAQGVQPRSLAEASAAIERIEKEAFANDPPTTLYSEIEDVRVREVLEQTRNLTVGALRNDVVHKRAYRPRRAEVELCFSEVKVLRQLKQLLNVRDFMEHQINAYRQADRGSSVL